jgi:hypothetical protein
MRDTQVRPDVAAFDPSNLCTIRKSSKLSCRRAFSSAQCASLPEILFAFSSCSTCCRKSLRRISFCSPGAEEGVMSLLDELLLVFARSIDRRCI